MILTGPNIYVFWKKSEDPPSPWVWLTRFEEYIRFTDSYSSHMADTGSETHFHNTITNWSCTPDTQRLSWDYNIPPGYYYMGQHSHGLDAGEMWTVYNEPPTYCLDIIYVDLNLWESSIKSFPEGAVILSNGVLTDVGYIRRFSEADGRYIGNGVPGQTFGDSTHYHELRGSVAPSGSAVANYAGYGYDALAAGDHTHTYEGIVTDTKTREPRNLVTRLYEILASTTKALSGTVVFADGQPSSNWTVLSSWKNANLKAGDSDPVVSGTDTHDHIATGTIDPAGIPPLVETKSDYAYGEPAASATNHTHVITITFNSVSHVPLSKLFVPIKLNTTLYASAPPVTYTKEHVNDVVLTTRKAQTYSGNIRLWGSGLVTIRESIRLRQTSEVWMYSRMSIRDKYDRVLSADVALSKKMDNTYSADIAFIKYTLHRYSASIRLVAPSARYGASIRLVHPKLGDIPVLDSIFKSYVTQIDLVKRHNFLMYLSNNIDYAVGEELDRKWGAVYPLPRYTGESDDAYRKRLKAYSSIQTGSGSKSTCERVLDIIAGEIGSSRVETHDPGSVRIHWNTPEAVRIVRQNMDIINDVVPRMLAAGINWDMVFEFADYFMRVCMRIERNYEWNSDMMLAKFDNICEYPLNVLTSTRFDLAEGNDIVLSKMFQAIYNGGFFARGTFDDAYQMRLRFFCTYGKFLQLSARFLARNKACPLNIDFLLRNMPAVRMSVDMQACRAFVRYAWLGVTLVLSPNMWDMGIKLVSE